MRKTKEHFGQNLRTLTGTEEVTTSTGALKTKNVWENHGLFPSRNAAQAHAVATRPGKKYHIEGVRIDVSPLESGKRDEKR